MSKYYTVQQGDCLSSIAFRNGFTWDVLWNDPQNADLKEQRQDPNILYPGDSVYIPDLRIYNQDGSNNQRHRFRLKHVPAKLQIRLLDSNQDNGVTPVAADDVQYEDPDFEPKTRTDTPLANVPYSVEIDDAAFTGQTDGDGFIECSIPPGAHGGRLVLNPGTAAEQTIPLQLGGMDPISEITGVKKRLTNLGFPCGDSAEVTAEFQAALMLFQEFAGCNITGQVDDATQSALKDRHGS